MAVLVIALSVVAIALTLTVGGLGLLGAVSAESWEGKLVGALFCIAAFSGAVLYLSSASFDSGEASGVVVERGINRWGSQFLILTDDGRSYRAGFDLGDVLVEGTPFACRVKMNVTAQRVLHDCEVP